MLTQRVKFNTFHSDRPDWGTVIGTKETIKLLEAAGEPVNRDTNGAWVADANEFSLLYTGNNIAGLGLSLRDRIDWLEDVAEENGLGVEILNSSVDAKAPVRIDDVPADKRKPYYDLLAIRPSTPEEKLDKERKLQRFLSRYSGGQKEVYSIQFLFYKEDYTPVERKRGGQITYDWTSWDAAMKLVQKGLIRNAGIAKSKRSPIDRIEWANILLNAIKRTALTFDDKNNPLPFDTMINKYWFTIVNLAGELDDAWRRQNDNQCVELAAEIHEYAIELYDAMRNAKEDPSSWRAMRRAMRRLAIRRYLGYLD